MRYKPKRKQYKAKPKRKWWRSKLLWTVFLISVIGGIAIYNIFFSPFFQIGEVLIYGNGRTIPRELQNFIGRQLSQNIFFFSTKSIFLISAGEIKNRVLENFPSLAQVEVKRRWPDTLEVHVQEREPKAIWCKEMACFFVDEKGIIFEKVADAFDQLIIQSPSYSEELFLGKQVLSGKEMADILFLRDSFKNELQLDIPEVVFVSSQRINVRTPEGWEVYFNFPVDDLSWQMTRLKLVLQEEIPAERRPELEYIDLRFSKIYYRYLDSR